MTEHKNAHARIHNASQNLYFQICKTVDWIADEDLKMYFLRDCINVSVKKKCVVLALNDLIGGCFKMNLEQYELLKKMLNNYLLLRKKVEENLTLRYAKRVENITHRLMMQGYRMRGGQFRNVVF